MASVVIIKKSLRTERIASCEHHIETIGSNHASHSGVDVHSLVVSVVDS